MKIVNGEGIINPDICIVGEAPGAEEETWGKPFVGRSGQLLNQCLQQVGIDRSQCYVTNAVKFRPPDNRKPTDWEIDHWGGYLAIELAYVKPKLIITLGSVASRAVLYLGNVMNLGKDFKITKERGKLLESNFEGPFGKYKIIPTLHPSYCLRNSKEVDKLVSDLETALCLVKGEGIYD